MTRIAAQASKLWLREPCGASCDRREALINFNICSSGDRWITDLNRSEDSSKTAHRCQGVSNIGRLSDRQGAAFPDADENCPRRGLDFFLCRM
jgi:hypothetical protein